MQLNIILLSDRRTCVSLSIYYIILISAILHTHTWDPFARFSIVAANLFEPTRLPPTD